MKSSLANRLAPQFFGGCRYHFNGQEKDDEVYGKGNMTTAEFWQYDTRLGRRWNIDPVTFPSLSGYSVMKGNPIGLSDPKGDQADVTGLSPEERTQLINDMSQKTGYQYDLVTDPEDGSVYMKICDRNEIARDANGNKIGSAAARREARKLDKTKRTYYFVSDKEIEGNGEVKGLGSRTIYLNFDHINSQEFGGDLNPGTNSVAMIVFHELYHTDLFGIPKRDPAVWREKLAMKLNKPYVQSRVDKKVNKIRSEMGEDYGQRMHYFGHRGGDGRGYIAYEKEVMTILKAKQTPIKEKHRYVTTPEKGKSRG